MIVKNFKPEIRNNMGHQYFKRYKALMHVANEIEEELAQAAEVKKAFFQYKKITRLSTKFGLTKARVLINKPASVIRKSKGQKSRAVE